MPRGNFNSRHPATLVREARRLYVRGKFGYRRVANKLGLHIATVTQWINGSTRSKSA